MIFNRFNISIVLQVILIALTTSILIWASSQEYMLITSYSLVFVWILQIIFLIYYVQRTNRELVTFLQSIKFKDTTIKFNKGKKNSFKGLHESFAEILEAFSKVRIDKEQEHHFFQTIIQHIGIGLIAFDESGKVEFCNKAAYDLFQLKNILNIKSLDKIKNGFSDALKKLRPNHPELQKIQINNELKQLSINATLLKIQDKVIKLVSFQDIKNEIAQGEMDAWQKLIRILTHEIMNSVSPITLLSSSLIHSLEKNGKQIPLKKLSDITIKDSLVGLKVIQNRSKGLSSFVEEYRNATQIPAPKFSTFEVKNFFENIKILFSEEIKSKKITFSIHIEPLNLKLTGDKTLMEQVLINLVNNAIYFLNGIKSPKIDLIAKEIESRIIIKVRDNGPGISSEFIEDIFIPFFSTKEKGTGIGLSLSRQIMRLHKGTISIQSKKDKGSTFTLSF